jgi:hypothetical protein
MEGAEVLVGQGVVEEIGVVHGRNQVGRSRVSRKRFDLVYNATHECIL